MRNAILTACVVGALGYCGWIGLTHPDTPLPDHWNPLKPLNVAAPVTLFTPLKLAEVLADGTQCTAVLSPVARMNPLEDYIETDQCGITDRVALSGVGDVSVARVETRCQIALRMAMWEEHTLQPAAIEHLGEPLARIEHYSSYSCRPIRTGRASSTRMSTHSTADAIDISAFVTASGRRVTLQAGWDGAQDEAAFLRAARDGACTWFETVLSPDYNALHADHFHLQNIGWGSCR